MLNSRELKLSGDPDRREKGRGDVPGDNPKRQRGREGGRQEEETDKKEA